MGIVKNIVDTYKCNYCYRIGSYTDWVDGIEISVCFKHLKDHNSG
jgi:hypothetical protein